MTQKNTKAKKIEWKTFSYHPKGKTRKQVMEYLANEKKMKEDRARHLKELAIYLEGILKGQGNILPLGEIHLKSLWTTINNIK